MDMSGERRVAAPRDVVWAALNDTEALKASIPGCESVEKVSDTEFKARVQLAVGPVKAKFQGNVTLKDIDPPNGYILTGQGTGGAAGFGKGEAKVTLREEAGETVIAYTAHATVGGKLAQLGQRLIDTTAKKMADQFFSNFVAYLGEGAAPGPSPATPAQPPAAAPASGPAPAPAGGAIFWAAVAAALIVLWFINH
jgi:hypothetical protein